MSSYIDVKNLIISNIKANGQREITGPILQDVLLNMLENSSEADAANKEYVDNKIADIPVEKGSGNNSIIQKGSLNTASSAYSSAFGYNTTASMAYAHAEGYETTASGTHSHVEGYKSTASGQTSHAEGTETKATNDSAHAEGYKTTAARYQSHAEGNQTYAAGVCSHTEGFKTKTTNKGEHAEGLSNISIQGKTVHTVGIGSAEDNVEDRKNAEEIHVNGDKYVFGIGGYDGTNSQTEGIKTVQEVAEEVVNAVQITYAELKSLRDAGKLVPGQQYRITDYTCTTTQSNTKSAGHPFDIIVTADDESTLNEEARAALHTGDEYFSGCSLNAWKLWYCLDNDTNRFAWADSTNGKGVIYRMIDEFNNDVPYDFKNIQFYRQWDEAKQLWSTISSDNTGVPCYTFSSSGNSATTLFTDTSLLASNSIYSNVIGKYVNSNKQTLNNICFFGNNCYSNTFGNYCNNNTFGDSCQGNTFGNDCSSNTFGNNYQNNTFGNSCGSNTFGNGCCSNTFGNGCYSNTFGNDCNNNTFGNSCGSNTFGNNCWYNTFGNDCWYNTFGNSCYSNTFGNDCSRNTFGNNCSRNTFGNDCYSNTFGNSCGNNTFGNDYWYNTFGNSCSYNTFGNSCIYIKFASDASATTKYNYYKYNHFGDGCQYIVFTGAETAGWNEQVQNYNFSQGLQGTDSAYLTIDGVRNRAYETYISRDTDGTIKESVIAEKLDKVIEISYNDLVTLRGSSKLVPGQQYRITDYTCTTTQANTKSTGHQFDIIVTADDESTLNEEARAALHTGDEYFSGCSLNAWKIWYCLDNDTTRFAWADATNGKGVIYRMIDEFNNDVPYDFKNIQFKHPMDKSTYPYYYYTFASDNIEDNTDYSFNISNRCYSNIIREYITNNKRNLNCIIFIGYYCYDNSFGNGCYSNSFGNGCYGNSFGNKCYSNSFGNNCYGNSFGNECYYNSFEETCRYNILLNYCYSNSFGSNCLYNILLSHCYSNSFGRQCSNNSFGSNGSYNTLGSQCNNNSFGNNYYSNILGNYCSGNTFGNSCIFNSFSNYCSGNFFGFACNNIMFSSDSTVSTKYSYYQNNHFGDGCQYIVFTGAETASSFAQVQNYNFAQGLQGTSSAYLTIDGKRNLAYETKVAKNSNGEIKTYCEADLIL